MANHRHNKTTQRRQGWDVKGPKSFDNVDRNQRVNLDPEAFDKLIRQQGVNVKVYRTTYCPNVKSIDGAEHNVNCDMCNGSGFIDLRPICTKAFIQNQNLEALAKVEGIVDSNSVAITFPIGIELQYFTRIDLADFTDIVFQRVARSETDIDNLKYEACRVNVLIDQNGVEYFQGNDYKISPEGSIQWFSGKGPAADTIYSINYESTVQFRAVSAMHNNRFSQAKAQTGGKIEHVKFPEQWACTKEYLVRRQDVNGQELLDNPVPGYDTPTDGAKELEPLD